MSEIHVADSDSATGRAAGLAAADAIVAAIDDHGHARVIFASAPSQEGMLATLAADSRIAWEKVRSFHMDEYLGLHMDAPQAFGRWLLDRLPPPAAAGFERIRTDAETAAELRRYSSLISAAPIDLTCLGVGVNGHVAFNEPGDTDFDDLRLVREVQLDDTSRQQQVDDGLFETLAEVPTAALSLTVPALTSATTMVCTVLGSTKANAVVRALTGGITTECPASILRSHSCVGWYLDHAAASRLPSGTAVRL